MQLPPDGTRQFYVLIGERLGRNPGLTTGAGTSVVYHSVWSGAKGFCGTNICPSTYTFPGDVGHILKAKCGNGRGKA